MKKHCNITEDNISPTHQRVSWWRILVLTFVTIQGAKWILKSIIRMLVNQCPGLHHSYLLLFQGPPQHFRLLVSLLELLRTLRQEALLFLGLLEQVHTPHDDLLLNGCQLEGQLLLLLPVSSVSSVSNVNNNVSCVGYVSNVITAMSTVGSVGSVSSMGSANNVDSVNNVGCVNNVDSVNNVGCVNNVSCNVRNITRSIY